MARSAKGEPELAAEMSSTAKEESLQSMPMQVPRINSAELFQKAREIEIDHQGRIYRLRLTQLNKLILTA